MSDSEPVRLAQFSVEKLFGEFSYEILLSSERRITAIIAPNGSGKTASLRLIDALFRRKWSVFTQIEFKKVIYTYSDDTKISIVRNIASNSPEEVADQIWPLVHFIQNGQELQPWEIKLNEQSEIHRLDRYISFLTRVGQNRYVHDYTGQSYSAQEALEAFADQLPPDMVSKMYPGPPQLWNFLDQFDCHLIETQRLLILNEFPEEGFRPSNRRRETRYAIQQKAEKLKQIIARELTAYAALSQSLDRSFPVRVMRSSNMMSTEKLKQLLGELDIKRKRLMGVGILDVEATENVELPADNVDDAIARLLSVYVDDTHKKLDSLEKILSRVQLFKELVEERFRSKSVVISRTNGFSINYRGKDIPLDKLSSGEQHQLVLFFELLFELERNALILIDEPELSLHVSWQRKFIGDLTKIIGLNEFDVVLATHSPQLIADWEELTVDLGSVEN